MLGFKFISDNQIMTKMERWKLLEFFVFGETFKILSPSPALLKHVNFEPFFSTTVKWLVSFQNTHYFQQW